MVEQNFPTYIQLDGRDFFYLTHRPLLPGPDVEGATAWRTKGLPQHGFPYAMAIAQTNDKLRVARFDPRAIVPAASGGTDEKTPTIAVFAGPLNGKSTLYFSPPSFAIGNEVPKDALDWKLTGRLSNRTCDSQRVQFRFAAEVQNQENQLLPHLCWK